MTTPLKRSTAISKNIFILSITLTLVVGFISGTRSQELLGAVAPILGIKVESGTLELGTVQTTYQQLKANYDGQLDEQALIDGANRGLVEAAGDTYTVFMDKKESEAFDKDLSGEIGGGIGAEIGVRAGQPTIVRVLAGNAAEKVGVKAGDIIIKVNDEQADGWDSAKAAGKIRGESGTTVRLEVRRATENKQFTMTRAIVSNPSVYSEIKDGVGILTITRFDDQTSSLAKKAAENFKQQQVTSVILDLRGNGGGYITAAQDVAGLWLDRKTVVTERTAGKVTDELKSGGDALLVGIKTVVLVNEASASASEIVAGALQDYKVATLVGQKTFGKGTVQKVIDLGADTQLKVTVARWYTPNGKNITKDGIIPEKKVSISPEQISAGEDPQLEAAKLLAR